jgi:hypothetical protein
MVILLGLLGSDKREGGGRLVVEWVAAVPAAVEAKEAVLSG